MHQVLKLAGSAWRPEEFEQVRCGVKSVRTVSEEPAKAFLFSAIRLPLFEDVFPVTRNI